MNSGYLLLGFLLVTIVWQVVAQSLGPIVGGWIYSLRVENLKKSRFVFNSEEEVQEWRDRTISNSLNWGLILLALFCGGLAGAFGFPLIGFSRSVNLWSWARIIALCASSWVVLSIVYPGMY